MSKTVGYVLTAALIVVAIAVPVIGPTALAAWGITAGTVAAVTAALSAAIMVNSLLMPKPKVSANAQETTLQIGEVARRAIFGKAATAGSLVDAFNYGGKYGTDHEVVIFALCDHEVEELDGVYVNDVWVPWAGDGNYPQFDTHHLSMYFRSGTEFQSLPSVVDTYGPGWTSADNGAGICYAVVDYLADKPDAKHPAWPGGRPTFLWVVKGKKCYDPRLDDTVGGSGSHRWDDPSTREYSENPIIHHYNYMRGVYACERVDQPAQLLVGRGLTATEIPPANIFAAANLCDELADDDLPRYTTGGVVAADEKYLDVAEKFAAACGGIIIQPEGSVEIEPAQARTPSFTVTDDDILVGTSVEFNQQILSKADSEWVNTVIPRYVSPAQKWQDHGAPVRRVDSDLLSDGGSREEEVVLQYVTVERQASDVGEIHRKLGRLWGRGSIVLPPRFAEIEEGDWGTWTSARLGFSLVFRVESYALDGKWQNALKLREINADVYDGVFGQGSATGSAGEFEETTPPIDIGAPDSGNWSLAAVTVTGTSGIETPALEITGDSTDDDSVESIIFEYWKDDAVIDPVANPDDPTWSVWGTLPPSTTKVDITGIEDGADYFAAVTYVVSGAPGDRLVLGPVTAGSADISGAVDPIVTAATNALAWKQPVRAATTANGTLASAYENGDTIDGVTLATGDRILIKDQTTGSENGIYVVNASGAPTRAADADSGSDLLCATVKVSEGTTNADTTWGCTNNATITVGTTALVWAQAGGAAAIEVKDEGSTLTSSPTSINFTGGGVGATASGDDITVNIPGTGGSAYEAGAATPPTLADLATWDNQGTSTATNGTGAMILSPQADGNIHGRYKTAPSTPYDVYCRVEQNTLSANAVGTAYQCSAGILFKDTGGDNERLAVVINLRHDASGGDDTKQYAVFVNRYSGASPPVFSATSVLKYQQTPFRWLRVNNDGTTLTIYAGNDGKNWHLIGTETLAAYIDAAASFGVVAGADANCGAAPAQFSYFSTTAP